MDAPAGPAVEGSTRGRRAQVLRLVDSDAEALRGFANTHLLGVADETGRVKMTAHPNITDIVLLRHIKTMRDELYGRRAQFIEEHDDILRGACVYTTDRIIVDGQKATGLSIPTASTPRLLAGLWSGQGDARDAAAGLVRRCFDTERDFVETTTDRGSVPAYNPRGVQGVPRPQGPGHAGQGTMQVVLRGSDPYMDRLIRLWNQTLERN